MSRPRRTVHWTMIGATSLGVACGGCSSVRPTRIDDARVDRFIVGRRCPEGATKMPDATIRVEVIEPGTGEVVAKGTTVRVHYVMKSASGRVLHDTRAEGAPSEIIIGSTPAICGFELGLVGMRAGEQRRIFVPWQLAFGDGGRSPEIEPRSDLVFLVDLYLPAAYEKQGVVDKSGKLMKPSPWLNPLPKR